MIESIEIPQEVPVMTLSHIALFPQAMMPLYIFEDRYRMMIKEVLAGDRIFALAGLNQSASNEKDHETPFDIGGIGMVRACKKNPDGTSNLILQGLARVEFEDIVAEKPFRRARIRQVLSSPGGSEEALSVIKPQLLEMLQTQIQLGAEIPDEVLHFLGNIPDPEAVLDLAISTLCRSNRLRQQLLETTEVILRYRLFTAYLHQEIERLKIDRELTDEWGDDDLSKN